MGYFVFNGINTADYGIYVTGTSVYGVPARDYTQISIPGRNGDIFIDNGRYKNIDITYHCSISGRGEGFLRKFEEFRRRLTASLGYQDLTDSYTVGYLRRGVMAGSIFPKAVGVDWFAGEFDVTFNCKPQMFLEQGRKFVQYTVFGSGGIDDNGADYDASQVKIRTGAFLPCSNSGAVKLTSHHLNSGTREVSVFFYNNTTFVSKQTVTLEKDIEVSVISSGNYNSYRICTDWQNYLNQESEHYPYYDGYLTVKGDYEIGIFDRGAMIYNETMYTSKPTMRFTHCTSGATIKIGNYEIEYAGGANQITIDCERQTAYNTVTGKPVAVTVTYVDTGEYAEEFPSIIPGENKVTVRNAWNIQIQTNIYTM